MTNTKQTYTKVLTTLTILTALTGMVSAATDGSLTDQSAASTDLGPGDQKIVQETSITDSGSGDSGSLDVDSFTLTNTGSAADSEIAQVTLWKEDGSTSGFQSGEDTKVGSSVSSHSLQEGVVIGSDDDNTVLSVADSTSETLYVTVTMSSDLATGEDTNTVSIEVDASDLQSSSTSSFSGDGIEIAGTASNVDAEPVVSSATTKDVDNNGQIDQVDVTFSESVSITDGSSSDGLPGLNIGSYTQAGKDYAGTTGTTISVDLQESGSSDTGSTPEVTYDGSSGTFNDSDQNTLEAEDNTENSVTSSDTANPVITSATTFDSDNDGKVDGATLTSSESVDSSVSSGTASDFEIAGNDAGNLDVVEFTDDSGTTSDDSNSKFRIELSSGVSGTEAKQVNEDGTSVTDGNGNQLVNVADGDLSETDGAAPVVTSAAYRDSNSDLTVETVDVDFSEEVDYTASGTITDDWSTSSGDFSGLTVDSKKSEAGNTVTLEVTGTDSEMTGTPSTEPSIDYSQSGEDGVEDKAQPTNEAVSDTEVLMSDEVAPVLLRAEINQVSSSSSNTIVDLTFSESIDSSGTANMDVDADLDFSSDSGTTLTGDYNESTDTVLQTGNEPNVTGFSSVADGDGNNAVLKDGSNVDVDTFRREVSASENGWNFVSFPIADETEYEVSEVMDSSSVNKTWRYKNGSWDSYVPGRSSNEFTKVEGGVGYLVDANATFTLAPNVNNVRSTFDGTTVPTKSIDLVDGWNLVGQFQEFDQTADTTGAFGSLESGELGDVEEQDTTGLLDLKPIREMDGSTSNDMKTGQAYWVWAKDSTAYTRN